MYGEDDEWFYQHPHQHLLVYCNSDDVVMVILPLKSLRSIHRLSHYEAYGIIAVPTGIVSALTSQAFNIDHNTQACPNCDHPTQRRGYCHQCGEILNDVE